MAIVGQVMNGMRRKTLSYVQKNRSCSVTAKLRDTTVYNYYLKEYGNITIGLGRLLILYYTLLSTIIISDRNENVLV